MKKNYTIFSGTANEKLAFDITRLLGTTLGKIEITKFADSEIRIRIEEDVTDKNVFVIASLSNPVDSHLVELCLIADALKANDAGKLIAIVPYYGYARQDKAHRPGEGISARVMAKLIEAVDFQKIVLVDLHSELVEGFFRIPVIHLFGPQIFVPLLQKLGRDLVIVSPDAGAVKRSQKLAELINLPLAFMEKRRNLHQIHQIDDIRFIGDTKGKTAVLVDDVVTSGSTLVKSAYLLKERGAKKVIACVTHADLIGGTRQVLQESPLDKIYVSDTIVVPEEYRFPKLELVTIAPLLAEQIKKMI